MSNKWKNSKHSVKGRLKKYKKNKKRSNLALAVAEKALRKAEDLQDDMELKFEGTQICAYLDNNIGQIITIKSLNNFGQNLSSADFFDPSTGVFMIPTPDQWSPCIYNMICVEQDVGETKRIGNDITMSHLTIKGRVQAWTCDNNIGAHQFVPVVQKVHMLVILDRDPTAENETGAFINSSRPFMLFPPQNDDPLRTDPAVIQQPTLYQQQAANVFSGYRAQTTPIGGMSGPGIMNTRTKDLLALAYQSKDYTNCPDSRFKILHKSTYVVQQGAYGGLVADSPYRYSGTKGEDYMKDTKDISVTIKAPYKFHFKSNSANIPTNQSLLVAFISDTPCDHRPTGIPVDPPTTPPTYVQNSNTVIGPHISISARFSYRDA